MTPKATVSLEELRKALETDLVRGIKADQSWCSDWLASDEAKKRVGQLLDAYREAAVMAERERCVKVCDELRSVPCDSMNRAKPDGLFLKLADNYDCARAIRTDPGTVRGEGGVMGVYEPEFIHKWTDEHGTEVEAFIGGSGHGVVYAGFDGLPPVGSTSTGLDPTVKELLRLASDLKAKDSELIALRSELQRYQSDSVYDVAFANGQESARAENVSLKQRVQELEDALKPFADFWPALQETHAQYIKHKATTVIQLGPAAGLIEVTYEDFKTAHEALGGKP